MLKVSGPLCIFIRERLTALIFALACSPRSPVSPEDPATGSANCALAGLLAHYSGTAKREF